jgi:hypothetical protein
VASIVYDEIEELEGSLPSGRVSSGPMVSAEQKCRTKINLVCTLSFDCSGMGSIGLLAVSSPLMVVIIQKRENRL